MALETVVGSLLGGGGRVKEKGPVEGVIVKVIPLNDTGGNEKAERTGFASERG